MSLRDQREDGLHRHGRFPCLMVCHSQMSKDRAEGSFVCVAGVLRTYQRLVSLALNRFRMSESILNNTHMPICTLKELLLAEIVPPVQTNKTVLMEDKILGPLPEQNALKFS